MLPETVWICKLWDRTVLEVLAKERRDKELPIESILSLEWSLVLYFTFRNHCGSMWLLSMFLSSYDTDDSNMTHRAFMIFASSKIECLGRDSPWLPLFQGRLLQLISQGQKRCALPRGRKTWERSWDNRLPACRQDRVQWVQQYSKYCWVAPGSLAACCNCSYLIHTLFIFYVCPSSYWLALPLFVHF